MAGDGINDAPALARADVGLAIGAAADVAAEAGDIVFMGDPLGPLPLLVRLSRETVRIIRQNILIFAFGVNGLGILLTAWLWPLLAPASWYEQGPVAAVIYHQIGSLLVLLNAMRLLWFDRAATSKTWQSTRQGLKRVDYWLEHYFNLDEGLHWLSHRWKPVAVVTSLLLLAGYALSGFVVVGPDEVAVVRRFGQPLPDDLTPGLHWLWPWPVDSVTRVKPDRVQTVAIGFRTTAGAPAQTGSMTWASPHTAETGQRRVSDEAVMITGDGDLLELQATVRYRVKDWRVYLFEVSDPEAVLRSAAEAVLREVVGSRRFADLLTADRGRFQQEVLTRLAQRCRESGPNGLGVELDGFALHDVHPPQEVVRAYHEVTKAMEARDRLVNDARATALRKEREAEAQKLKIERDAYAARYERTREAEASRAAFEARYLARTRLSWKQEWALLAAALSEVLDGRTPEEAHAGYAQRRRDALAAQASLTDFRIFWDNLGQMLRGREKVVIDADKVPGRRHLLLFDPGEFRVPAPILGPGDRMPPRSPPPGSPGEGH
jgi:Cu+-exporting ATPase